MDIKVIKLLIKHNNKEDFAKDYKKIIGDVKLTDIHNLEKVLTESLKHEINTKILIDAIWIGRMDIIRNLRELKLKRILKKNE